ncbi:CsgE family curli-type amyloid fiber assembly protein [Microbulbifer sp. JMSA004]|uniref:CsgE family curli-type amyloid fiber assembly protein n=1 Tax=unclassified Microbulbifer TaxID=2619833 RepID=UPI0024AE63A2|nr:CsgE family curli-type amyloid fiber assembly protein [Microbulbifer sp. VAAF005]WHI45822.1 CsgE family curli-type amyloid fiber assembly protein [Microbulbifer sp. VAAF005]
MKSIFLRAAVFAAALSCIFCKSHAQEADNQSGEESLLTGLVIDNTVSGIGHEFARSLSIYITTNLQGFDYNLTVHERPSARWGSVVWVTYESQQVFKTVIYPGRRKFGAVVEQAASQINNNVRQQRLQELLSQNIDLAGDEI